jgi:4-aminobutyrate aminotransferase
MLFKHQVSAQNLACFLIELVQGEGGYYPVPASFLAELSSLADRHGILMVYDEVQTGFGRTAQWFASDHYAPKPDIIVLGKGIANGLPLSAFGSSSERVDAWPKGSHGTTFGGNPVACAAALAVREVMGDLLPNARDLSAHAFERLSKLKTDFPIIGDVRGLGLMIGVELVKDPETREPDPAAFKAIQSYCLERELILIDCGPDANVIRFIPPLITTRQELHWAIDLIGEALATV